MFRRVVLLLFQVLTALLALAYVTALLEAPRSHDHTALVSLGLVLEAPIVILLVWRIITRNIRRIFQPRSFSEYLVVGLAWGLSMVILTLLLLLIFASLLFELVPYEDRTNTFQIGLGWLILTPITLVWGVMAYLFSASPGRDGSPPR